MTIALEIRGDGSWWQVIQVMVVDDRCWLLMMTGDDSWWHMVVCGVRWWLVMTNGDAVVDDGWWLVIENGDSWCQVVVDGVRRWWLMKTDEGDEKKRQNTVMWHFWEKPI
jgi:hypothetical protein